MAGNLPSYSEIRKKKAQTAVQFEEPAGGTSEETSVAQEYINSFSSKTKDKRVAFRIQSNIYNRFAELCEKEGATVSFKIGQLIRDEIKRQSEK